MLSVTQGIALRLQARRVIAMALEPPPDWAHCRDSALEASQQEEYCWLRVRFWARWRSRDWRAFGSQPALDACISEWRRAADTWGLFGAGYR
eukprot:7468239-Alexandrium_andersonii.AAC.1